MILKKTTQSGESVVPVQKFILNLEQLTSSARLFTQKIIIVGITDINSEVLNARSNWFRDDQTIGQYNQALEEFSIRNSLFFVDMKNTFDIYSELADGVHPNARGYEKMYQKILPAVEQIINGGNETVRS